MKYIEATQDLIKIKRYCKCGGEYDTSYSSMGELECDKCYSYYWHRLKRLKLKSIFLAGGITDCPDWQSDIKNMLATTKLILLNPRRKDFPIGDPNAALEQIRWEHNALRAADYILFWFPCETLCPIVLYELGAWSMTDKKVFVGVHPRYQRRQDVEIQSRLVRPDIEIKYSLRDLADQVTEWACREEEEVSERDIY